MICADTESGIADITCKPYQNISIRLGLHIICNRAGKIIAQVFSFLGVHAIPCIYCVDISILSYLSLNNNFNPENTGCNRLIAYATEKFLKPLNLTLFPVFHKKTILNYFINKEGNKMKGIVFVRRCLVLFFCCMLLFGIAGIANAAVPVEKVFIENLGQWNKAVKYHMLVGYTETEPGYQMELWLTGKGYLYHTTDLSHLKPVAGEVSAVKDSKAPETASETKVRQHAISVTFMGAQDARVEALEPMGGTYNWLVRKDASQHVRGARAFKNIVYRNMYPGIDVLFEVVPDKVMETTILVAPGSAPDVIALQYEGANTMTLDASGSLVMSTTLGDITEMRPYAFQETTNGQKEPVYAAFVLTDNQVKFKLGNYDKNRTLYIDPTVAFSRTFGGSGTDTISEMHEDATGRYFTGVTASSNFPMTVGAYDTTYNNYELFAVKFDLANQNLLWATYVGSDANDYGGNSALAPDGSLYIVGSTNSNSTWAPNPPTYTYGPRGNYDIGIVHLSSNGQSVLSGAVLGGTNIDYAGDIEIHGGDVYVCGSTLSPTSNGFPIAPGFNTTENGQYVAYILRFNSALSGYLNMTFIPGSTDYDGCSTLAFDGTGNVYADGITYAPSGWGGTGTIGPGGNYDFFIAKYDATLTTQYYDTRIGGASTDPTPGYSYTSVPNSYYQTGYNGIIVDSSNRAWATGMAASTDFPTTPGAYQTTNGGNYDVFVLALNAAGTALDYSTFMGGNSTDGGRSIQFDSAGNVYIAGLAASNNYPTTSNLIQTHKGNYDFILSVLSPDLSDLLFSTYWGGTSTEYGADLAIDDTVSPSGSFVALRIAGSTAGGFPLLPTGSAVFGSGGGYDGAVAELSAIVVGCDNTIGNLCYVSCFPGSCPASYCNIFIPGFTGSLTIGQVTYLGCTPPCPQSSCTVFVPGY
jgi:hypothetical protein